jgi:hypothetical protein
VKQGGCVGRRWSLAGEICRSVGKRRKIATCLLPSKNYTPLIQDGHGRCRLALDNSGVEMQKKGRVVEGREEAAKSESKGAVQAPFETLLDGTRSTELVRRASSRDIGISGGEKDYCRGEGWMELV